MREENERAACAEEINELLVRYRRMKRELGSPRSGDEPSRGPGHALETGNAGNHDAEETNLHALRIKLVRLQNDYLRRHLRGGRLLVTAGVQSLGADFTLAALAAVRSFNTCTQDNDPYGEHDFGAIEVSGRRVFFKIDAYDEALRYGSEDPALPEKTVRVLTIMLAEEY